MLNKCCFLGRCGKQPEIRTTQGGKKVASFSLAVSEKWRDRQSGEQREATEWLNCVSFGNNNGDGLAGVIERFVNKGDLLYVEGKFKTEKYQAQDGSDRYAVKIHLSEMKMIPTGNTTQSNTSQQSGYGQSDGGGYGGSPEGHGIDQANGNDSGGSYGGAPDLDDEIPF